MNYSKALPLNLCYFYLVPSVANNVFRFMHGTQTVIILGDFNSKVGECTDKEHGIGPYGLGTRNACGEKLADFCQANDMVVTNTCFHHPKRQR